MQLALLALAGLVAGAVNAVAGGGSLLLFPALLAVGLPPLDANVTNSVAQWPSYLGAATGQRRDLAGQGPRLRRVVPVAAVGALVGALLLLVAPEGVFDALVPALVIGASLLMAAQPWLKRVVGTPDPGAPDRPLPLLAAVFLAAVYGGYFGGALGVILVVLLALTASDTLRRLNATKAVLSLTSATVTIVVFGLYAPVHWGYVAALAPATLLGGFLGGRLAGRLDERVLRAVVVVLGLAVGVALIVT